MCTSCGCAIPRYIQRIKKTRTERAVTVDVMNELLADNDRVARENRKKFDAEGVLVVNLMSSPGAGKTSLLEATIANLKTRYRIGVIEGDLETENDAARIRAQGVPAFQITTGTLCHLDAKLVRAALDSFPVAGFDLLFIENVGNLVCPAGFDLGQHKNVTLLSATEGDDKPEKYPVIFRASDLVLLSKVDLLDVMDDFSPQRAVDSLRRVGGSVPLVHVASRRKPMLEAWLGWLDGALEQHQHRASRKRSALTYATY